MKEEGGEDEDYDCCGCLELGVGVLNMRGGKRNSCGQQDN